jgi:hypothetical protein
MLMRISFRASLLGIAVVLGVLALGTALEAQNDRPTASEKSRGTSHLRIEVTGGDESKPVADASVYLRFPEKKKDELDLKTNQEGVARSPEIRQGKVLIQIVAPGWKTYGEYHDVSADEQTIQIHLVRPTTRWYGDSSENK